jgi:outer membrane lipoprotein-sorting protein
MKKWVLFLFSVFVTTTIIAQSSYKPATKEQQNELIRKITEASEQLKTLQCDFVQKKTFSILSEEITSTGRFFFKQKDKVRWEYNKPYLFEFVMNGNKVMTNSEGVKNTINVSTNKIFSEMSKIIIAGVCGAGIFDPAKFSFNFLVGEKDNRVVLSPKQKDIKQIFNVITICFNLSDQTINSVEMEELNGDKTLIIMKNKQINKELSDEIFVIH